MKNNKLKDLYEKLIIKPKKFNILKEKWKKKNEK
jgi:hypothetical protein